MQLARLMKINRMYEVNKIPSKQIEEVTIEGEKTLQQAKLPESSVGGWADAVIVSCSQFEEGISSVVVISELSMPCRITPYI